MENDALKSAWQRMNTPQKSASELKSILQESTRPVLRDIRRQLLIEMVSFTIFLSIYYDFFDGSQKPFWANVLLVATILLVIGHNLIGYVLAKGGVSGSTIKQSLEDRLFKIKTFAIASIAIRILSAIGFWFFFLSVIKFDERHYWLLVVVVVAVAMQLTILSRVWLARIRRLSDALKNYAQ